jgi:hypothetical protein
MLPVVLVAILPDQGFYISCISYIIHNDTSAAKSPGASNPRPLAVKESSS